MAETPVPVETPAVETPVVETPAVETPAVATPAPAATPAAETTSSSTEKSFLEQQGEKIRAELAKATEKFKELPQVKAALAAYDENMERLRKAMDNEMARKIFDLIEQAKAAVYAAIEKAQQSSMGIMVQEKISEVQNNASAKLGEFKSKVPFLTAQ